MPSPELRASDADRQVVVTDLQRHYADGRLTTEELRERIGQAMAARTYADLDGLQRDLPRTAVSNPVTATGRPVIVAASNSSPTLADCRQGFRAHALSYASVISGLIVIWLLTSPGGYFWPVWPMFGWGIGLASHGIAYRLKSGDAAKLAA
jgi:hypothetical protein